MPTVTAADRETAERIVKSIVRIYPTIVSQRVGMSGLYAEPKSRLECAIAAALAELNGGATADKTSLERSENV